MNRTLLIAESDAELREIYRVFLQKRGFAVETASDGLGCLAMLRRLKPDLLILDRELPWGGGDGVLACLRQGGSVPAVVLTTTAHSRDPGQAATDPSIRLLVKPFALNALWKQIAQATAPGMPGALQAQNDLEVE